MSSSQTSRDSRPSQPYLTQPNATVSDPPSAEIDTSNHHWMVATIIEDGDLMFGGKPLSTWYEEERRQQNLGADLEEGRRGRSRERPVTAHQKYATHHHHHHGHKVKEGKA